MVKFKKEHTEHNSKNAHSDEHPKEKVVAEDLGKENGQAFFRQVLAVHAHLIKSGDV